MLRIQAPTHALDGQTCPTTSFEPADGMFFTLEELQGAVGGYIELTRSLSLGRVVDGELDLVMVVNEEGRLKGLPRNPAASCIAGQPIFGDVAIVHASMLRRD